MLGSGLCLTDRSFKKEIALGKETGEARRSGSMLLQVSEQRMVEDGGRIRIDLL